MNNRYIFRGKRKDNGEWIEGNLINCAFFNNDGFPMFYILDTDNIEYDCWEDIAEEVDYLEVIPKTVGQCTGLKDKDGKWIFEGDIVRTQPFSDKPYSSKAKYKQHIGVVEYRVSHFKNSLYEQDYKAEWIVNIKDYGKFAYCNWNEFFKCEVIGNIHDNRELLEVER